MSNVYTTDQLISSIKRRGMIPSDEDTFDDQDFLNMLNEELSYFGVTHLLSTYEEYLVTFKDIKLEDNKYEYEIPSRAIGNKLRGLFFVVNTGSNEKESLYELSRVELEDVPEYNDYYNDYIGSFSSTFYVQNNKIILTDEVPFSNASLRMYFYLKPNTLVKQDRVGKITNIDRNSGVITIDKFINNFSNLPEMDFVQAKSPNQVLKLEVTPSSVDSNTKTLTFSTSDIPDNLVKGDYVCLAGESIVPQLPEELHPVLAQRVAVAALEALGDFDAMKVAQTRLQMMERSTLTIIDNRVESANQKIRNSSSPLQETLIRSTYSNKGKA